ncbi:uncharacterized protein N7515_002600 [Penicillium bovifimosum]|uniref:Uncharacterized protein n=1 Tax=Penicillium bovifimosum TaxID=126998 RepID=A0A9W9HE13_9EURO|nr:uncharacterized protein N7515_002600 [Penicillium bovifimosum]KAJ5143813.1 hypothetical protein N7515_002600 [Penicillium bovifimosum]
MSDLRSHTFAYIVFGGSVFDTAQRQTVAIAKKFMADELHPRCLSGTDLHDITNMAGPFLFGREDLRDRVRIYDSQCYEYSRNETVSQWCDLDRS